MEDKQTLISDEMSEKIIEAAKELVLASGHSSVTVRKILQKLDITNRVYYNRFRNIEEVLDIVYRDTALKIRETITVDIDPEKDFFDQIIDVVANTLSLSYDHKKRFSEYFFRSDSLSKSNFEWWQGEIKRLIEYAKSKDLIIDVDSAGLSYAIWCFCRGYNADAVSRNLPKEEAVKNFKYCFAFLLEGIKKK